LFLEYSNNDHLGSIHNGTHAMLFLNLIVREEPWSNVWNGYVYGEYHRDDCLYKVKPRRYFYGADFVSIHSVAAAFNGVLSLQTVVLQYPKLECVALETYTADADAGYLSASMGDCIWPQSPVWPSKPDNVFGTGYIYASNGTTMRRGWIPIAIVQPRDGDVIEDFLGEWHQWWV
jgi:hypothetical protein